MALWQTEFMMVPKDKLYSNNNIKSVDISSLWSGYIIKNELVENIVESIKPKIK